MPFTMFMLGLYLATISRVYSFYFRALECLDRMVYRVADVICEAAKPNLEACRRSMVEEL